MWQSCPIALAFSFAWQEEKNNPKKGVSGGDVILIIFFCGVLLPYLVFGALFMKYRRGASGLDLIPNREFWMEVPGLIKDGFMFTIRGFKTSNSYSQI